MKAFAMGADMVNIAREAMLAIGCIQAQECHTDKYPTGITTQNKWLSGGLDPTLKAVRFAKYINTLRKETLEMTHACGYEHPCQMKMKDIDMSCGDNNRTVTLEQAFQYEKEEISFGSMNELFTCNYLAGLGKSPNQLNIH